MTITQLRQSARQIWDAALQRANPSVCVRENLRIDQGGLWVPGKKYALGGRILVIGAGKASAMMAKAVEEILQDKVTGGLIVTKHGHGTPLQRIEIVEAGHPVPDTTGVSAVEQMRRLLSGLTPQDIVLCLISGGGSALWPAPAAGVTIEDKQHITSLLLRAGASIRELNAVRKHLSMVKGGELARWAAPARVISLIISDVIGDPLDFIASGPTAPDTTSFRDALTVIQKYGISAPAGVMNRLEAGARGEVPETPKPGDPIFENVNNVIIANNRILIDSARERAEALGFNTTVLATELEGEARQAGVFFAAIARQIAASQSPVQPPACVLSAGETTVTVRGKGVGGRNQEMALAWAISIDSRPISTPCCFASVASDGSDGPTDAAGGLVDPLTCSRAVGLGLQPNDYLNANDSLNFLKATGDLIVTGPTQTNLMDLQILLVG
jgi:glycerate-2-kinase